MAGEWDEMEVNVGEHCLFCYRNLVGNCGVQDLCKNTTEMYRYYKLVLELQMENNWPSRKSIRSLEYCVKGSTCSGICRQFMPSVPAIFWCALGRSSMSFIKNDVLLFGGLWVSISQGSWSGHLVYKLCIERMMARICGNKTKLLWFQSKGHYIQPSWLVSIKISKHSDWLSSSIAHSLIWNRWFWWCFLIWCILGGLLLKMDRNDEICYIIKTV